MNQEKNSVLLKAENQYQRAFHDLSYNLDQLHSELGNALAVHTKSHLFHKRCLMNVWRLTSQAQSDVNQLPLTLMPFLETEQFLSNLAKFSYRNAVRDLSKQPLAGEELRTLAELHRQSEQIKDKLREVQANIIDNQLRWMDVEVAMASEEKQLDNAIIGGFQAVNKQVGEFSEVDWGSAMAKANQPRTLNAVDGTEVGEDVIRSKAAQFLRLPDGAGLQVTENGTIPEFRTYTVTREKPGGGTETLDLTKKGGHLFRYMNPRDVTEKSLNADQATEIAEQHLKDNGFEGLVPVAYDEYQNVATLTYAASCGGIIHYPEKLTAEIALDNGKLLALQAIDLVTERQPNSQKRLALSQAEARNRLNPEFQVEESRLAVVRNELDDNVLCHEFVGVIRGTRMRVYLNADTGIEEKVETLKTVS